MLFRSYTKTKGKRQKIRNLNQEIMFFSSVDCCTGFTAGRLLFFSGFAARVNGLCGSNFAKKNKKLLVVCTADTHRVQHITTQIQLPWPTRFL